MTSLSQGDIIRINGFGKRQFVVVSRNAFIKATGVFHVCPMISGSPEGPLHIVANGSNSGKGTVICEQIKMIDPGARSCTRIDSLPYSEIMNISDAIQGIFEYD